MRVHWWLNYPILTFSRGGTCIIFKQKHFFGCGITHTYWQMQSPLTEFLAGVWWWYIATPVGRLEIGPVKKALLLLLRHFLGNLFSHFKKKMPPFFQQCQHAIAIPWTPSRFPRSVWAGIDQYSYQNVKANAVHSPDNPFQCLYEI